MHTPTPPQSNLNGVDSCSWFCRKYAKSTNEVSVQSECFQSHILYVEQFILSLETINTVNLLLTSFRPVNIPFKDGDVCLCIIALDVLAACKWQ